MRFLSAAAVIAVLSFSSALAADDVMASFYGNTVISKGGMGEVHTYYKQDHTFVMKAPAFNTEWKGAWKVDGANMCRTFDGASPPGVTNPLCLPIEPHKLGDTWSVAGRTVTLVPGIQ